MKAISGDMFLGGSDFDNSLCDWLINEIRVQTGRPINLSREVRQFLLDAAVTAKCTLSQRSEYTISLPYLEDSESNRFRFATVLSRGKFEQISEQWFDQLREPCRRALEDAGVTPQQIDRVLLVGGATRMPNVVDFCAQFFGKVPSRVLNPDEAVALGAGVQSGVLSGDIKDVLLLDALPLSLGVASAEGEYVKLVERNTIIPTRKSETFSTMLDDQSSIEIRILQGERPRANQNRTLGYLKLSGLAPRKAGEPQVEVTFDIDANGILNVSVKDKAGGSEQRVMVNPAAGLTHADIIRLRGALYSSL